jgi:peroxiredoxin
MKLHKVIVLLLFLICTFLNTFAKDAVLKGKVINNTKFKEIYLQDISFNTIETQTIDAQGQYSFNTKFDKFDFYLVAFDKDRWVVFIPEPGEQSEITIDMNNLKNPDIKNSVQTSLYYYYSNKLSALKSDKEKIELIKTMINENTDSPVCIFFVDLLSTEEYFSYHQKLSDGLKTYSYNTYVSDYIKKTDNVKKLSLGSPAPEIALKDPEGKVIKLSSLKGQYVLIDFWASWCKPCRMENPNNVKLYEKYHDKGFEIYGVSLDKTKEAWVKAIEDDQLKWIHVSDLQFWQSEGAQTYNVQGIPHTVLLDKEGKIMAVGLRGETLKKKLVEIFGE